MVFGIPRTPRVPKTHGVFIIPGLFRELGVKYSGYLEHVDGSQYVPRVIGTL